MNKYEKYNYQRTTEDDIYRAKVWRVLIISVILFWALVIKMLVF